jgi:hypothetical protein
MAESVYSPKVPILREKKGRCKLCRKLVDSVIETNDIGVCLGCFLGGDVAPRCYYRADCIPLRCIPCSERGLIG